jgi:hypothetical protein
MKIVASHQISFQCNISALHVSPRKHLLNQLDLG